MGRCVNKFINSFQLCSEDFLINSKKCMRNACGDIRGIEDVKVFCIFVCRCCGLVSWDPELFVINVMQIVCCNGNMDVKTDMYQVNQSE